MLLIANKTSKQILFLIQTSEVPKTQCTAFILKLCNYFLYIKFLMASNHKNNHIIVKFVGLVLALKYKGKSLNYN